MRWEGRGANKNKRLCLSNLKPSNFPYTKMIQTELNQSWEVIKAQVARSKIKRFNWKELLGTSLSSWFRNKYTNGMTPETALKLLFIKYPYLTKEAKERAKIGASARYAEYIAHNPFIEVKK